MNRLVFQIVCIVLSAVLLSTAQSGADDSPSDRPAGQRFETFEAYVPRYPNRVCPPETRETRERLESYLSKPDVSINKDKKLKAIAPRSPSDFRVLNAEQDAEACRFFNDRYDEKINTQVRLTAKGRPQYWYDVAFYKGGGYYFVISDGGIVEQVDPDNPERVMSSMKHTIIDYSILIFHQSDYELVEPYIIEPLEPETSEQR